MKEAMASDSPLLILTSLITITITHYHDFPGGSVVEESSLPMQEVRVQSLNRKIPQALEQLSPPPQLLELRAQSP